MTNPESMPMPAPEQLQPQALSERLNAIQSRLPEAMKVEMNPQSVTEARDSYSQNAHQEATRLVERGGFNGDISEYSRTHLNGQLYAETALIAADTKSKLKQDLTSLFTAPKPTEQSAQPKQPTDPAEKLMTDLFDKMTFKTASNFSAVETSQNTDKTVDEFFLDQRQAAIEQFVNQLKTKPYDAETQAAVGDIANHRFESRITEQLSSVEAVLQRGVASRLGRLGLKLSGVETDHFKNKEASERALRKTMQDFNHLIKDLSGPNDSGLYSDIQQTLVDKGVIVDGDRKREQILGGVVRELKDKLGSPQTYEQIKQRVIEKTITQEQKQYVQTEAPRPKTDFEKSITGPIDAEIRQFKLDGLNDKTILKQLARKYHPDVSKEAPETASEKMKYITSRLA